MAYKIKKINNNVERRDYSKVVSDLPLPNLIEIQTETFEVFKNKGIQEVFDEFFPMQSSDNLSILTLDSWGFEDVVRTIEQAKEESKIYEAPIYVNLKLAINRTEEISKEFGEIVEKNTKKILMLWLEEKTGTKKIELVQNEENSYFFKVPVRKVASTNANRKKSFDEDDMIQIDITDNQDKTIYSQVSVYKSGKVYLGDFPLMTDSGTFIINGSQKIVVSQLVRSPGVYFKKEVNLKTGENIFGGDIIPSRGTWLEFKIDSKKVNTADIPTTLSVKIDKARKTTVTSLLTVLGMQQNDVLNIFENHPTIIESYNKDGLTNDWHYDWTNQVQEIYRKIRQGEMSTPEGAIKFIIQTLFDKRKYDLTKVGRFKLEQKLSIKNRVLGHTIAEDIVDENGNVLIPKDTQVVKENLSEVQNALSKNVMTEKILLTDVSDIKIPGNKTIQKLKVYKNNKSTNEIVTMIGILANTDEFVTIPDILSTISYLLNMEYNIGSVDDIDHLGNRRVRSVGELLQNQFRIGMNRIDKNVKEKLATAPEIYKVKTSTIINAKPLTSIIGEFFNLSQLSQFMDQINPLSELTNKRRVTALGPGGLSRDRAGLEVRDVHPSHYGRICPIETPEGPNIGLINNLSTYAKINEYGFITTPYRKVNNGVINNDDISYLTADEERNFIIAESNVELDHANKIMNDVVVSRYNGDDYLATPSEVDYIDVSPKQIVSVATSAIPFLENDDANRALMGANMQRQAVPLINPESPIVGTGIEFEAARDSGSAIVASEDGVVLYVDSRIITVESKNGIKTYKLSNFDRSNNGTALLHSSIVSQGDKVKKGQIIADGTSMEQGELAIGQNVVVAFSTYNGFNFEDAIVMSERVTQEDKFTSVHIDEYTLEIRNTKIGPEIVTRELKNVSEQLKKYLDADGIVAIGTEVKVGDILVGKVTPRGIEKPSPEDKLLNAIFGEKSRNVKDNSLRVPNGGDGIVQAVKRFKAKTTKNPNGVDLPADILEIIKIYVVQKRKIQEGDKMSGRHGNKGIVSRILPVEDMPHLEDGTPVDIILNPQGIPSRMNIGQILEVHLGMAAMKLGCKVSTPVFEGISETELEEIMTEAGMSNFGKVKLIDGQTGEAFDKPISVGVMYMLKLSHMVDDKLHARNVGPYSLITQQPLGGKAQNGGQRFGEMEVWALEAYGAAHTLREILTIKSDDIKGRTKTYESIVRSKEIPDPGIPESFNVLIKEIMGLGFNMYMLDQKEQKHAINAYEDSGDVYDEESLSHKLEGLLNFENVLNISEAEELVEVDIEEIEKSFIDEE